MKSTLIFATANTHKMQEVAKVIDHDKYEFLNLLDVNITEEIEETGDTLEENALIKARYVYQKTGKNVFSEDTGLEISALDGMPGVITARYAGPQKDAQKNMDLVIKNLSNYQDRSARFRAVIALIIDGNEVLFEGIVNGTIATVKSGVEGFGYDPIFIPQGHSKSFAELPDKVKLEMSHRTRAINKMLSFLEGRKL
ncbi:MAG: RdgB/HAM1 family non-canonical purine NTP pyrophosphatase [Saprospiraceae bacterium]